MKRILFLALSSLLIVISCQFAHPKNNIDGIEENIDGEEIIKQFYAHLKSDEDEELIKLFDDSLILNTEEEVIKPIKINKSNFGVLKDYVLKESSSKKWKTKVWGTNKSMFRYQYTYLANYQGAETRETFELEKRNRGPIKIVKYSVYQLK